MGRRFEIKNMVLYIDGSNFASDVINACKIQISYMVPKTTWLTLDAKSMDKHIGSKIKELSEHIFNLRQQQRDETAIDLSDAFFQSFTPLMNIFVEQRNFYQISNLWNWLILRVKNIEEQGGIQFGKGLHKGTAFYFLGFSRLMMGDVDGAYLFFAEAAKDDEILPESVLNRHQKGLPPVVKILLLDLSKDNFAYSLVRQIRETIKTWEQKHADISRKRSVFDSMENAIEKNVMPRESAIHFCYASTKAFTLELLRSSFVRSTFLAGTQLGDSILRFVRSLEDFVRFSQNLTKDTKLFSYCNDKWFRSENWNVPSYEDNLENLVNDFISNKWSLSKDGRNLLFSMKIRNVLAHRIPNSPGLFNKYVEIILAISSSFGFICDEISK